MRTVLAVTTALTLLFASNAVVFAEEDAQKQQNPQASRLVVDNRTSQRAVVEIWRHDGRQWAWRQITTINGRQWVPVYSVNDGERLRATLPDGAVLYHSVKLQSGQDVWWLDGAKRAKGD